MGDALKWLTMAVEDAEKETKDSMVWAFHGAAREIGEKIEDQFRNAIMDFYRDYRPVGGRTASMFQFARGIGGKKVFYKRMGKNDYKMGIYVDPSFYEGNPYEKDHGWDFMNPSIAFNLSYLSGIHGFDEGMVRMHQGGKWNPKRIPPVTTPPDVIMEENFNNAITDTYISSVLGKFGLESN